MEHTDSRDLGHYFKGVNFMTPIVIIRGFISSEEFYEISQGEFLSDKIFGVTLANKNGFIKDSRDTSFRSYDEAEKYVSQLIKDSNAENNS